MTIDNRIYNYVVNEEEHADRSVIIKEGGHGNWAYLVLEGTVKLKKKTSRGLVTTETLGPGDIFGESAMFQEGSSKRSISAVADGPVMLGLLDANRIVEEFNRLSPQMRKLLATLTDRLDGATQRVVDMVGG